ncbi:MAG: cytochrome c [Candidatus Kapabacteria bacterium]|nr:cytochrome c [Candidatus Kapabacteria bacterium]
MSDIASAQFTNDSRERNSMNRLIMMAAFVLVAMGNASAADDKAKLMARGQQVYNEYCKTCHQANGQGLGAVYPPLAKSDYLKNTPMPQIIKEVVNGKSGKIKVNGKEYNGVMAPLPKKYNDQDIASVITYVYNSFGNSGPTVSVADVKKHKKK